ncbi:MAG: transporter [Algibacter sp.]|uniref:transporter n=1 Tax=Algibacter sp. TaxID=1872428 RepID=UPI00262C86EF|nr:transporter [Algibacter sp.]MDG1728949.1 transporter [Algibacter sp.]MDG2177187.1 transporter [Algibacter sp.]
MNKIKNITTALFFIKSLLSFSQQDNNALNALITDRPDATESPSTIPAGYVQVETGTFYESFKDDAIKNESYTLNTTLVRLGLLDNLELRVGWDFVESKIKGLDHVMSGFNPLLLGAKIAISEEKGGMPEIGFLSHLYLPFTAGNDYKPETTGVDFRFAFAHTLNEKSSLSYNLGAQWGDDSPEAAYIYSLSYGYSITDKLGAYAELYGDLPENNKANHLWNTGFTYLLSNNFQLDATVGSSITKGQDILLSGGISFRLPTKKN